MKCRTHKKSRGNQMVACSYAIEEYDCRCSNCDKHREVIAESETKKASKNPESETPWYFIEPNKVGYKRVLDKLSVAWAIRPGGKTSVECLGDMAHDEWSKSQRQYGGHYWHRDDEPKLSFRDAHPELYSDMMLIYTAYDKQCITKLSRVTLFLKHGCRCDTCCQHMALCFGDPDAPVELPFYRTAEVHLPMIDVDAAMMAKTKVGKRARAEVEKGTRMPHMFNLYATADHRLITLGDVPVGDLFGNSEERINEYL